MSRLRQHQVDGRRDAVPLPLFGCELSAAGSGEGVRLDAPPFRTGFPRARDIAPLLEAVERGEERSGLDAEGAARELCAGRGGTRCPCCGPDWGVWRLGGWGVPWSGSPGGAMPVSI